MRTDSINHNLWVRRSYPFMLIAAALTGAAVVGGCEKPLFAPDVERSQYDRYDTIRGQSAPSYVEDEFGRRQPNLRGRLMTKQ